MEIYPRDSKDYISSVMGILTNSVSCGAMESMHISTWIAGKDLMKRCCQRKK